MMKRSFYKNTFFLFISHVLLVLSAASLFSCSDAAASPEKVSWTIMFYANGDNNLENNILSDLKEMELSTLPEQITVIALVDRPSVSSGKFGNWSDTKLFRVVSGNNIDELASVELDSDELSLTKAGAEELNMNDASVITKFIDFCKSNYPSDKYALIVGSHGDGWKFPSVSVSKSISKSIGYDSTSHNTSTSIENLASALVINPPDVIVFDACNMGNIETLYDLIGCAEYIVASPNPLPLSGFNYMDVFSSMSSELTPAKFAFVFSSSWQKINDDTTMMVYSMDNFSDFLNSENAYMEVISAASTSNPAGAMIARNKSIRYSVNGISDHIDIVDYCKNFIPEKNISLNSFILTNNKPMLSFYFPSTLAGIEASYNYTSFATDTSWDEALGIILE